MRSDQYASAGVAADDGLAVQRGRRPDYGPEHSLLQRYHLAKCSTLMFTEDPNMASQASRLRDVGASLLILGLSFASVTVAKADEPVSPPNIPARIFPPVGPLRSL